MSSWLYRAADFISRDVLKKIKRQNRKEAELRNTPSSANNNMTKDEIRKEIDEIIRFLPNTYQDPLILSLMENLPRREIARILNLPEGTVHSRLSRGISRLRHKLGKKGITATHGGFAAAVSQTCVEADLPAHLSTALTRSLHSASAGSQLHTANLLLENTVKTLFWNNVKVYTIVIVTAVASVGIAVPATRHFSKPPLQRTENRNQSQRHLPGNVSQGSQQNNIQSLKATTRLTVALESNRKLKEKVRLMKNQLKDHQKLQDQLSFLKAALDKKKKPSSANIKNDKKNLDDQTELKTLLSTVDWKDIAQAVYENDLNENGKWSPKIVARMVKHLPRLLQLQKILRIDDIENLFRNEQVLERFLPEYIQNADIDLSEYQMRRIREITSDMRRFSEEVPNTELPA